jgi:cation:H+ antiporter
MTTVSLIFAGLFILVIGAESLVKGASRMAAAVGVSPLIIGLTVVATGTSALELSVSIKSQLLEQPGIAIGNVIGSNIFNILFILGLSAIVSPLLVAQRLIRLDVPLMIGVSLACLPIFFTGNRISRWEGVTFLVF